MCHRYARTLFAASLAMMLAACSGQPASPTAPTALDRGTSSVTQGNAVTASASGRASIASAPASRPSTTNFEITFMTDMIDHHHMAVMMAEMLNEAGIVGAALAAAGSG